MSTAEIPEEWARRIVQRGYVRTRGSGPNISALADDIGLHTSTVSNALKGGLRGPNAETIAKIVQALGPDTAAWFGVERVETWDPPASSALLTDRQRKALTELIESMTERGGERARSAPMNQADQESATDDGTTDSDDGGGEPPPPGDIEPSHDGIQHVRLPDRKSTGKKNARRTGDGKSGRQGSGGRH